MIGWLLVATGLLQAIVSDLGQGWALAGTAMGWPGSAFADLAANSSWTVGGALMAATFVLFPDGRRPRSGRVWAWVLPLGGIGSVVLLAGWATGDQVSRLLVSGRSPWQSELIPSDLLYWVGFAAMSSSMLLGALAMVLRLRQSAGVERQQLKWMAFAVGIVMATLPASAPFYATSVEVRILDALVLALLPLAALAAIWRYRLYDIELIISRTVLYVCVTVVLGASFVAAAVGLGVVFGRGSTTATALATLLGGEIDAALTVLGQALSSTPEPESHVRVYLDEGAPMVDLLRDAARSRVAAGQLGDRDHSDEPEDEDPQEVLRMWARRMLQRTGARPEEPALQQPAEPLADPLSQRESEVLRLLDSELSGPQIAEQLYVSLNTLRTHTKRIFTKLDVNSRAAAVRTAHDRGLI